MMNHKPLVHNTTSIFQTIIVMTFCHLSVTFLCINVMIDLFLYGLPLFFLHSAHLLPSHIFYNLTTIIINWTTPIVYGIPMVLSGTKVYIDHIDLLISSKEEDSLLLANHGSRIDWMVGMFIGHLTQFGSSYHIGNRNCNTKSEQTKRCRVGFVCEALIQIMPLIGWYRKIICQDIFVWRSFDKDESTIKNNISSFKQCQQQRMLFLCPEGVIVDHGGADMDYVHQCRNFCIRNGYEPFEYVLTPRYKGTTCLLDQIRSERGGSHSGPLVSACLVFVRDGKLLNCKLLSPMRVIPDIYDLNQGITGNPVSIYVHVRRMDAKLNSHDQTDTFDAKEALMEEYKWKDSILAKWDEELQQGKTNAESLKEWISQFTLADGNIQEIFINHLLHLIVQIVLSMVFNCQPELIKSYCITFCFVSCVHTIGWLVNQSSMESVPFETGIKALISFFASMQKKKRMNMKKCV